MDRDEIAHRSSRHQGRQRTRYRDSARREGLRSRPRPGHERSTALRHRRLSARTEPGLAGYRRAFEMAVSGGDEPLADLVAVNSMLARHHAGLEVEQDTLEGPRLERLASAASSRPMTWIVCQRLARELQVDLVGGTPNTSHEFRLPSACDAARVSGLILPPKDSRPRRRGQLPPSSDG